MSFPSPSVSFSCVLSVSYSGDKVARGTYADTYPDQFQPFIFPSEVIPNTTLPASKEGTGDNANGVDMRSYVMDDS